MKFSVTVIAFFLIFPVCVTYGQVTITGKVVETDNEVLPGATVLEKGTENFTFTDMEGNFTLEVTDSHAIIEFRYIGLKTKEVTIREKRDFLIQLKDDCYIDFFDEKQIGIGLSADPVHHSWGGFFQISHPVFRRAFIGKINYLSDFLDNHRLDASLGILHFLVDCDYNADMGLNYRDIKITETFRFKNYTVEGKLNFSRPRIFSQNTTLYAGFGLSDFHKQDIDFSKQAGYMLGFGTEIRFAHYPHWLALEVSMKAVYWTNFWEWKGEIACKMNRMALSAEFDRIDTTLIMGFKIGYKFGYQRIPSQFKQNTE